MDICRVEDPLVCTQRIPGIDHHRLLVVRNLAGAVLVATDPVGARRGNYVFTVTGTAGRWAMGDYDVLTDLAICGIIDNWEDVLKDAGLPQGIQAPATETSDQRHASQ